MEPFGDTFLPPELAVSWVPSRACPACAAELQAVTRLSPAHHWLCSGCSQCWMLVHGNLRAVDTFTCEGCATRTKAECFARFGAGFPTFTCGGLPEDGE